MEGTSMIVTSVRKTLFAILMALAILASLITGFAHTNAAARPTGVSAAHGQVADWCPAPPKVCTPIR